MRAFSIFCRCIFTVSSSTTGFGGGCPPFRCSLDRAFSAITGSPLLVEGMSASLYGPAARGRYRRGADLPRELRAGILTLHDCRHEQEKRRETSRMDPNMSILRRQVAHDYPSTTQ